jgi:uncharacterized surface protein with fasciclin (FAS1) repeats
MMNLHNVFSLAAVSFSFAAFALHAAPQEKHPSNLKKPIAEATAAPQQNANTTNSPIPNPSDTHHGDSYTMFKRELMKDHSETANHQPTETLTLLEIVGNNPSFSTLSKLLNVADLINALQGAGPFTIFAPNDAALAKLSPNTIDDLQSPENKDKLKGILTYHVVPGKVTAADLKAGKLKTLNGKSLDIKIQGSEVTVNNAHVIKSDVIGKNGVIHVIDAVLLP